MPVNDKAGFNSRSAWHSDRPLHQHTVPSTWNKQRWRSLIDFYHEIYSISIINIFIMFADVIWNIMDLINIYWINHIVRSLFPFGGAFSVCRRASMRGCQFGASMSNFSLTLLTSIFNKKKEIAGPKVSIFCRQQRLTVITLLSLFSFYSYYFPFMAHCFGFPCTVVNKFPV